MKRKLISFIACIAFSICLYAILKWLGLGHPTGGGGHGFGGGVG